MDDIPFNRPCLAGNELRYMEKAVLSGHSSAKGPFTKRASDILRAAHGATDVLLTTSCTDALEMSAMILGLGPGDVVILPSFTFSSTATAFARQGAKLRFCDITKPSLGLDVDHVRASITPEVKAIVTVHYAGVASDLRALQSLAREHQIPLIEDNAHGLLATHDGQRLGSFGRMSTLSFHETKNFTCGEGGALVVYDSADADAAHILLDKGTNRRQFMDGQVDKYTWQGHGSSFGMSDLLAAFLVAQLEAADDIQSARRAISLAYRRLLEPFSDDLGIQLPYEPPGEIPADHMFYVLLPRGTDRASLIASLRRKGINPTFHYVPLHRAPAARELADRYQDCPVTDDISARLVRLPFYNSLETSDCERVVAAFVNEMKADLARN